MKIKLKTIAGDLIFEGDFSCIAEAVRAALAAKKSLSSADLSSANLSYANLSYADLSYANLSYANLRSANLSYADLRYADLRSANLSYANLSYANLRSAKNSELAAAMTRILPAGAIVGWKKLRDGVVAKLRIPEEAKRSHAFGRKCRAEFAVVEEMFAQGKSHKGAAYSQYDSSFEYKAGATVKPTEAFSEDWMQECASGIHFFITHEEAEAYEL
jgi:hypothetical protein